MDSGAQQDTPDTGANASGAGTAKNASASDKSAGIEKGKRLKYQKSGLTWYQLLQDKLHWPRQNNQRPKLKLLKRLLSRRRLALSR
jgi:hypothetical protein